MFQLYKEAIPFLNKKVRSVHDEGESSFNILYWGGMPNHYDNPVHKHSFFEVCYCVSGKGEYIDNYESYDVNAGTLFLSRPGIPHQIRSQSGLLLYFFAFEVIESKSSESTLRIFSQLSQTRQVIIKEAEESPTALIWRALVTEAAKSNENLNNYISYLAVTLIRSLQTTFINLQDTEKKLISSSQTSTLLYQAKLFIQDNLSSSLNTHDVAGYLHISSRHLSRIFSEKQGETFTNYIRRQRISCAVELMKNSDLSIKLIAETCGFSSVHYFTRIFTEEMNQTPGRYRQDNN